MPKQTFFVLSLVTLGMVLMSATGLQAQHYQPPDLYRGASGWIDTDVSPEEALVLINGQIAGEADQFDGWPAYLWLEPGEHSISFQLQGYQTITRRVRIQPNRGIRFTDRLVPGESAPAEERIARQPPIFTEEAGTGGTGGAAQRQPIPAATAPAQFAPRSGEAYLVFSVTPATALVRINGRALGTAQDYDGSVGRALVAAGVYTIQIESPGYLQYQQEWEIAAGSVTDIAVTLRHKVEED